MNKIQKVSYRFSLIFKALIILYPLMVLAFWMQWISLPEGFFSVSRLPAGKLEGTGLGIRSVGLLLDMIPTAFVMASFFYLIQLFHLFVKNIIFSEKNVFYIRKIGFMYLYHVVAAILTTPFLSFLLTFDAPKGSRMISLAIDGDNVSSLLIAGIVILISWIIEKGRNLEEETALTV